MLRFNSLVQFQSILTFLIMFSVQYIVNLIFFLLSDSIAKMIQLEKCLFDGGASPQDIALVISTAAKRGSPFSITPGKDL